MATLLRQQPLPTWQECIKILQQSRNNDFPDSHPHTLMQAMQINLDALEEQSEYYLTLAIFINYTRIPQATVVMLWRYLYHLPTEPAYQFLAKLAEQGLLRLQESYIQLHTFQHDYLYTNCADVDNLHTHLLTAYRRHCQHGWASGPNDGYFFQYLCQHLLAAERLSELKSLLLDFDWLRAKWRVCPLHSLLKDYNLLPDDSEINRVKQALLTAAPTLLVQRKQLANQLFKQLKTNYTPDMEKLLNQLAEAATD
jgi:hypothetical protein